MRKAKASFKIIITLTQHPVLGALLQPYAAEETADGTLQVTDYGEHLPPAMAAKLTDVERKAIDIASRYTERYLMKTFSKEKVIPVFLKKLSADDFKRIVRPYIDKKVNELLELIKTENIPFYQNSKGNKVLYEHSRIDVSPHYTDILFDFEADDTNFHYSLECRRNGEKVSLIDKKPVLVLTASPASLLMANELHMFRDVSSMRIIPFTNKPKVSVSATETGKYLEKVVLPILRHHDITYSGLPIFEEKRECEPVLSVEENIYDTTVLQLSFRYGEESFYPASSPHSKAARAEYDENGKISLYFYQRDLKKEGRLTRLLKQKGLFLAGDSHFKLREDAPEQDMVEWITNHRDMISHEFRLMSSETEADYCLDDIRMEQDITEDRDWFELHMTVVIGSFRIPFIRFRRNIMAGKREYVLPDGRVVLLPEEWFNKYTGLLEHTEEERPDNDNIRIRHSFVGLVDATFNSGQQKTPLTYQAKEHVAPPRELKATLRHYQEEGFNWMVHLSKHRFGGCLADDMGLGKTLQTLTLLQYIYSKRQTKDKEPKRASLIVMPTSLLHNWRKEIKRFTKLSVYEFSWSGTPGRVDFSPIFDRYNLILISYGFMRKQADTLANYPFEYIVLDESQHIKNSDSQTFRSAVQLKSNYRLILTGTPIENSLKDLWAQFHFLQPELLGTESAFQKQFIQPIRQGDSRAEEKLQQIISPFILRRSKKEVAPELPELTEEIIYCGMTDAQKEVYQKEKNSVRNVLLEMSADKERGANVMVLNGINHLRQLACHPRMVIPYYQGTSGKMEEILSTFETLRSEGHKVLIFSSYVKHLELIAEAFQENGWPYALLTGTTTNREEEINRFAQTEDIQAFLISLKAGGVGLNLTQADYVFIVDPWWNPAAELQAIARAHRIGQQKQVFAYRFITEASIEEKIIRLQEEKKELFTTFITENNPLQSLTDKEWAKLLES